MDAVDVLTMAVDVARMIRSAADPEAVLSEACRLFSGSASEGTGPFSLRVTRLVEGAGERRKELIDFLRTRRGSLYLNRPLEEREQDKSFVPRKPDPEAE